MIRVEILIEDVYTNDGELEDLESSLRHLVKYADGMGAYALRVDPNYVALALEAS
jgi:hypothetical protein